MFGECLKKLRKKMKMTQAALAGKLGISPSTIGMYEQGRREPDSKLLIKIANFFGVSVDYLINSKCTARFINDNDELVNKVKKALRNSKKLENYQEKFSDKTINLIAEAVRDGIYESIESEN